jgi:hypothetical protein
MGKYEYPVPTRQDLTDFLGSKIQVGLRFANNLTLSNTKKEYIMLSFQILFSYYEKTYSAIVQRVSGNPVQYLVRIEPPNNLKFQNPFVLTADINTERIEYGIQKAYGSLGFTILLAVKAYCYENGIPLVKD